jgi:DNA-directed RNA polymerase subunit RPC12/RpoP
MTTIVYKCWRCQDEGKIPGGWAKGGEGIQIAVRSVCPDCSAAGNPVPGTAGQQLDNALRLLMDFPISRYLMSCAEGRWDGHEKAMRHIELCTTFLAVLYGGARDEVRREHPGEYEAVHLKTQDLTSYLDEQIGFPIKGQPDYDELVPKFFEKFIKLAREALGIEIQ